MFVIPAAPGPQIPSTLAIVPAAPGLRVPTAPDPHVPPAPGPQIPTAPDPWVPAAPGLRVPTSPDPRVPPAPGPQIPTAPDPWVPAAPGLQVPAAPDPRTPATRGPRVLSGQATVPAATSPLVTFVSVTVPVVPGPLILSETVFPSELSADEATGMFYNLTVINYVDLNTPATTCTELFSDAIINVTCQEQVCISFEHQIDVSLTKVPSFVDQKMLFPKKNESTSLVLKISALCPNEPRLVQEKELQWVLLYSPVHKHPNEISILIKHPTDLV